MEATNVTRMGNDKTNGNKRISKTEKKIEKGIWWISPLKVHVAGKEVISKILFLETMKNLNELNKKKRIMEEGGKGGGGGG